MPDTDWITIGRIVSPQGLKGEVRVYPDTDFPERFLEPGQRWLKHPKRAEPTPIQLLKGRYLQGKGLYVVQLAGVTSRNQAEALRNHMLLVLSEDRPELEENEFYVADLVGLRVVLQSSGREIGLVTDVYEAGNDLLEVSLIEAAGSAQPSATTQSHGAKSPDKVKPKKVMVPFVEAIVPVVDLDEGYVAIDPPIGLLEL
jgi:16S rRNA processing protein RimM